MPQSTPPSSPAPDPDVAILRLVERTQRIYGRIDNLPALLDLLAQTLIQMLEEMDPAQAQAAHLWAAAGLLSRDPSRGVFRPIRLKGRPDPDELHSFVQHVGPGDSADPTGLMGWSVARRKVAVQRGAAWSVAERDDEQDRWGPLRPADDPEAAEMRRAAIAAYPSVRAQIAVPILDPEIRGQARARHAIGIMIVESDALLSDRFCRFLIAFAGSIGHPVVSSRRLRDLGRLARRLALPPSRAILAESLLMATLPYLPPKGRRGFAALRDFRAHDRLVVEALTDAAPEDQEVLEAFRARRLAFTQADGLWGQAMRTRRAQYVPDVSGRPQAALHPLWKASRCALAIPLLSGDEKECLGLLGLESGETSYAFSTPDQAFFETAAALASVAVAGIREPRLEYAEAIRVPEFLVRVKCRDLAEVPEDQIVRVNAICRALIEHNFVFQKAAEAARLTVHILREYTSRAPRVIDVEALRILAARRQEMLRVASGREAWEAEEVR